MPSCPDPEPGPGEVRVDLVAAALNRRDWWIRTGGKARLPVVLGSDGAGIVSAVGPGVDGPAPGDEVVLYPGSGWGAAEEAPAPEFAILGVPRQGTYAERIVVPADLVRARPPGWSWPETAALPVAGLTAWRALVRYADAGPVATILVPGGGGGVATFAIQIGAALGARMLTTTSSPQKLERLRSLGARRRRLPRAGLVRTPRPRRRRNRQRRRSGLAGRPSRAAARRRPRLLRRH